MTYRTNSKKEQVWKTHISQANQFEGGFSAYCRSQNISVHTLSYWRKRVGKSLAEKTFRAPSPFIPVNIENTVSSKLAARLLPDPKWVAEFILHLQGGAQ